MAPHRDDTLGMAVRGPGVLQISVTGVSSCTCLVEIPGQERTDKKQSEVSCKTDSRTNFV